MTLLGFDLGPAGLEYGGVIMAFVVSFAVRARPVGPSIL